MFTAVVRITGAGRLEDFRERLRWLMVRDEDAEAYTEHHAEGVLEYRFEPKRGIPFPAFTTASGEFPELRVEAEWRRDGESGRAVIENGQLVEQTSQRHDDLAVDVAVGDEGKLELAVACVRDAGGVAGYALTSERHTYFRFREGALALLDPEEPDAQLEDAAFRFVDEWIWYDEEAAPVERSRYSAYGFPVRGANVKSDKLALLRSAGGAHSSLDAEGRAARQAIVDRWLKS